MTAAGAGASRGEPLLPSVRPRLERVFGVDLGGVRVHTDGEAADLTRQAAAKAMTVGMDIYLAPGERPADLELVAHEVAHVVQQQRLPAVQLAGGVRSDAHEREAQRASVAAVRDEPVVVHERVGTPRAQLLGLSDVLDYFADKANYIPGYRMFTIILGINPIYMSRVERSAANILRALIEFMPGGALITQALDNHGVFDKAGAFVDQQVKAVGLSGSAIKQSISDFLDSLGWRDIFHLGSVWDRAKRIFTDPITKLFQLAKNIVVGILTLIKDAILRPLAKLAEGTRAWDLLIAVLGKNPITGDAVPRNATTLIGGFMKLIGQQEVWSNMQKSNAVGRAWTWFQSTISQLIAFVASIPSMAINAFKSLELMDVVVLPRAFLKVGKVFVTFVVNFISWGLNAVWKLLEIIFDVVSPGAWGYIKKTGAALKSILKNPLPFVGNLARAAKLGFQLFKGNFVEHLKRGLIDWLTGSLPGVYIPKAFSLPEIVKFALSVLGISWANVRGKLVKVIGEPAMKALETTFDIVVTLIRDGPAAAWDKIKSELSNLKDTVVDGIIDFVVDAVVKKAIPKFIAMFIPGAGFISAIISIYDMVMVFVQKISKIIQVVTAFVNSIVAIAAGQVDAAAKRVESVLAGFLSLAIAFLAGFAGLGKVADKVMGVLNKVRAMIDKGIDKLVEWIVTSAKKLFARVFARDKAKQDGAPDPEKERKVNAGLAAIDREDVAVEKEGKISREDAEGVAARVRKEHPVFTSLKVVDGTSRWDYEYAASPEKKKPGAPKKATGEEGDPIDFAWVKPAVASYPRLLLAPPDKVAALRKKLGKARPSSAEIATIPGKFTVGPTKSRALDGKTIGVTNADSQIKSGKKIKAKEKVSGNGQKDSFNDLVEKWGYNREEGPTDGDHVLEKQLGGPDSYDNVWPLDSSTNRQSGGHVRGLIEQIKKDYKFKTIAGKWFKIKL